MNAIPVVSRYRTKGIGDLEPSWKFCNPLPLSEKLGGIACGNGCFVVIGVGGIMASSDARQWFLTLPPPSVSNEAEFLGIRFINNQFIAVGRHAKVMTSSYGFDWHEQA